MTRTIGVISIKGGVGKTTTVANLGSALAHQFGKKVLLVDANFSAANLGLHLGLVNPDVTIHEVLGGKKPVHEAVFEHEGGFDVLPASVVPKKVDFLKLKNHLAKIKDNYDYVLIDSSPSLNEEILATMMASDELLVVSSPDYPTLSCTMHAVKVAKKRGTPIVGLILNKVRGKGFEINVEDVEAATGTPVIAVLPDDIKLLEALSETTPGTLHAPLSNAVIEYKKLAGALVGEEFEDTRLLSRLRRAVRRDVPKHEVNQELLRNARQEG